MRKYIPKIILLIAMILSMQQFLQVRVLSRQEINKQVESFNNSVDNSLIADINKDDEKEDESTFSIAKSQLNTLGILYVPAIDLKLSIYDTTKEVAITNGAGIISQTGSLFKENGTNTVITSHNGSNTSDLFMNIEKLKEGDTFYVKNTKGEILEYKVFHFDTVDPQGEANTFLEAPADKYYMTLRTCTQSGGERIHVTGEFVRYVEEDEMPDSTITLSRFEMYMLGLFSVSTIFLIVMIVNDIKDRKKEAKNSEENI